MLNIKIKKALFALTFLVIATTSLKANALTGKDLDRSSLEALQMLYKTNPLALEISYSAKAVLIFPNIVKAGLIFGGGYGEGVLTKNSIVQDYYNSVTGSWGLQAGAQSYGYVVFLMTDNAVNYLDKSNGWEVGVGPTIVVVDAGIAENLSTLTLKKDAYAFIFNQQGLMASVSIEGTKISKIKR
jgi:lipid-binding SYLF domain-containing protein